MKSNESSQRMIDELMERVAIVEKEKAALASQQESYAEMSDAFVNCKKKISEMTQSLEAKEKLLEKEHSDKASIEHSQEELLKKMKELQKENDQLVIKLEGLKTENETLITKNKKLENRFKILEDQNKQQLKQIEETLKIPTPTSLHEDAFKSTSLKSFGKIDETRKNAEEVALNEQFKTFDRKSSPPQSENVSTGKPKKLKIVEPLLSPTVSSIAPNTSEEDQVNTSTINSQDAPNVSNDSPVARRAFAEIFSRSGETEKNLTSGSNY